MRKIGTHKFNYEKISEGFKLPVEEVIKFLNDGRVMGRLGEFIHSLSSCGERQNENSSFDILEEDNQKSEIRSITNEVSFASSKEVGYGRKVTEKGFIEKLNSIDRYILLDLRNLKNGTYDSIEVTKKDIEMLSLGKTKKMKATKFFKIYDKIK
jgi:hypothetical protein